MSYLTLQIKQADGWTTAVIPSSSSIAVEQISTIFDLDAGGGFSYPFTLPVEANQHLFPTMTNNHGAHIYDLIYHKPFRLFVGGVPLLHGVIDMDDEVDIETQDDGTHTIAINLASDNQELAALLDGVNCQDVPVKDRIPVGTEFRSLDGTAKEIIADHSYTGPLATRSLSIPLPPKVFSLNKYHDTIDGTGGWVNPTNVSAPYPDKAYCNTRVCIQKREKQEDGTYKTLREYEIFEADRPNSGICFYVLYFLDCLFAHYNISFDNTGIRSFEDMNRLAFFTTKCEGNSVPTALYYDVMFGKSNVVAEFKGLFDFDIDFFLADTYSDSYDISLRANAWTRYANSKNFPDTNVMDIIKDLQNAFGIRFIFSSFEQSCKAVFIKDVFNDRKSIVSAAIIHSEQQTDYNIKGVKMTFGVDDEDNTDYNYKPSKDDSNVIIYEGYNIIKTKKGATDKNTYYDSVTGNMYRIKVDEDASTEAELYPSLFEVGQFCDASIGDVSDDDKTKEIPVSFSPVVCNITEYTSSTGGRTSSTTGGRTTVTDEGKDSQAEAPSSKYSVFIDAEISDYEEKTFSVALQEGALIQRSNRTGSREDPDRFYGTANIKYKARYGYSSSFLGKLKDYSKKFSMSRLRTGESKPIPQYDEDPLSTYDSGYTLGIMRGPGNQAGVEVIQEDYDGNGNARWAYVPKDYAFTSDSIDHFGNVFDYNGVVAGGVSLDGRTSLKLQAEKNVDKILQISQDKTAVVSTPKEAEKWISALYQGSSADLLGLSIVSKDKLSSAGWDVAGIEEFSAIYPYVREIKLDDSTTIYVLLNAIRKGGWVLSKNYLDNYSAVSIGRTGKAVMTDPLNICIKASTKPISQKEIETLNALINIYYFNKTEEPYTITEIPEDLLYTSYYPIDSSFAHRGLFHKFNYEYAWFLLHSRLVELIVTMSLAELSSIDFSKWYTFGQYTGLIKQISYNLDNEKGLSEVTVQLYYI